MRSPRGVRTREALSRAASLALLLGIVAVLSLPPAGAKGVSSAVLAAPFTPAERSLGAGATVFACGSATAATPTFSLKTGIGGFADWGAAAANCTGAPYYVAGQASSGFYAYLRLPTLTKGSHTVSVNWTVRAEGWENLSLAKCTLQHRVVKPVFVASCYEESWAWVGGSATIYDETTGQTIAPQTSWNGVSNLTYREASSVCYSSRCHYYNGSGGPPIANQSFSYSGNASWTFSSSQFSPSDTYWVETGISGFADSEYYQQNAAWSSPISADSHVIVGSPSGGTALVSVTIG